MGDPNTEEQIGPEQHRQGLGESTPAKSLPVSVAAKSSLGRVHVSIVSVLLIGAVLRL